MRPSKKAPPISELLERMAGRSSAIRTHRCVDPPVGCGKPIDGFKDQESVAEYRISGLCQSCQDAFFKG